MGMNQVLKRGNTNGQKYLKNAFQNRKMSSGFSTSLMNKIFKDL